MIDDTLVIGSGPAGAAATAALLAAGRTVKMLDIGARLESDRANMVLELAGKGIVKADSPEWSFARAGLAADAKIPLKTAFGSDFPYGREATFDGGQQPSGFGLLPSQGFGGFSNVWGATLLRLIDSDMKGWPFGLDALAAGYGAVEAMLPISAHHDGLSKKYPTTPAPHALKPSDQAAKLLHNLERRLASEERAGLAFGHARVAVGSGCRRCGMCLYGCPYRQIFNSSWLVEEFAQRPGFSYVQGARVHSLSETGDHVEVAGRTVDGRPFSERARRVFLAAGALGTPLIMLLSMQERERELRLQDSQYFLLPAIGPPASEADRSSPFTLAQLFLEIEDASVAPQAVHSQLYTFNDYYADNLRQRLFRGRTTPLDGVVQWLASRMLVIQSYLHSDLSPHARLRLAGTAEAPTLHVEPRLNPLTKPAVKRVWRRLASIGRRAGMFAVPLLGQIGEVGRGYHSGGTFPMRKQPQFGESDILGRPFSFSRVHIVDGSCLPTIPSTAPTLTIMANAHRIASTAAREA
jgi:choline dehydrogenase-like flavoprotein